MVHRWIFLHQAVHLEEGLEVGGVAVRQEEGQWEDEEALGGVADEVAMTGEILDGASYNSIFGISLQARPKKRTTW